MDMYVWGRGVVTKWNGKAKREKSMGRQQPFLKIFLMAVLHLHFHKGFCLVLQRAEVTI